MINGHGGTAYLIKEFRLLDAAVVARRCPAPHGGDESGQGGRDLVRWLKHDRLGS